ncbi:DEAD/DEAH box helicase [Ileibacterium valens]|uniref:DEAD/DEAH box helicase n=1 Tax=Ileibacterium valens TaxID=1862668 RepID=UPI00272B83CD|nr:DEAD/DEAH box helicase [Ileibacterium valens]
MKFVPHDYQKYAIDFVENHCESALLLSMGLGKTVITLTAINNLMFDSYDVRKVLVVAPLRVASNTWPSEIQKWDHLKDLKIAVAIGSVKDRMNALKSRADIYIINRENLDWLIGKSGLPFNYDMVVLDELSSFKSHQTNRFKALASVRPRIKRIVGLTGTPASNSLMDLWAEFKLLDMGVRLGRYITRYRESYFHPDKMNGQQVYTWKPVIGAKERIFDAISDMTISMESCDFLDMPERIDNVVSVELNDDERKAYDSMKDEMVAEIEGKEIDAINAASLSNKLLQMANGAVYDDNQQVHEIHKRKLDALEDLIESANGNPVLVAYWYKHDLERIQERFKGRTIKTEKDIKDWNSGKIQVGLIHPASAGHGLNLQAGGSILIWFGLTWSLELYQQTNARLFRQGQKETVIIHHIVCKDTIDEDVMKALERKDQTQSELIKAVKARIE